VGLALNPEELLGKRKGLRRVSNDSPPEQPTVNRSAKEYMDTSSVASIMKKFEGNGGKPGKTTWLLGFRR
jgi:hypothetical protein